MRPSLPSRRPLFLRSLHRRQNESKRRCKKARTAKNKSVPRKLCFRQMGIVFDKRIPDCHRERLAARTVTRFRIHKKSARVVRVILRRLTKEANSTIRSTFLKQLKDFYFVSESPASSAALLLRTLQQDNKGPNVHALSLLHDTLTGWDEHNEIPELCANIVRGCLVFVERHLKIESLTADEILLVLKTLQAICNLEFTPACVVDQGIDSVFWLPYLFDIICEGRDQGELSTICSHILYGLLSSAQPAQRVTLTIRHYTRFQQVFACMALRDLAMFMHHNDFGIIMAATPSLLRRVAVAVEAESRAFRQTGSDFRSSHFLAAQVLDAAVNSDSLLQKCLGYGLLAVSQHFARTHYSFDNDIDDVAPVFRQCLDKYPEFKQLFKELTAGGDLRVETAQIGAAIVIRKKRPGQWYILDRDDDDVGEL